MSSLPACETGQLRAGQAQQRDIEGLNGRTDLSRDSDVDVGNPDRSDTYRQATDDHRQRCLTLGQLQRCLPLRGTCRRAWRIDGSKKYIGSAIKMNIGAGRQGIDRSSITTSDRRWKTTGSTILDNIFVITFRSPMLHNERGTHNASVSLSG